MGKKKDVYLDVVAAAFVARDGRDVLEGKGKMVLKFRGPSGEDILGFSFNKISAIDSCIDTLTRIRDELEKKSPAHPAMSKPTDGQSH